MGPTHMVVGRACQQSVRVDDTLALLTASDLRLLREGVSQLLCLAWLVQEYHLHIERQTEVPSQRVCSTHRVTFRDEHGGDLEEVRFFVVSTAEQILKVSPQVPERLSDSLVKRLDHADCRSETFQSIRGAWVALALSENGSEVVLKSLDLACEVELRALTGELEEHVLELARSAPGSAVLQYCIEQLSPSDAKFIVAGLGGQSVSVAEDPFGREVVRTLLEHMPPSFLTELVGELPSGTLEMCTEPHTLAVLRRAWELEAKQLDDRDQLAVMHVVPGVGKSLKTWDGRGSLLQRALFTVGLLCTRGE